MKKSLLLLLTIGLIFQTGCAENKESNVSLNQKETIKATNDISDKISTPLFSNLVDEDSLAEVQTALQQAGIKEEKIKLFVDSVKYYNEAVSNDSLIKKGFVKDIPTYDLENMSNAWNEKNPDFMGFNCRITAFSLFNDFIKADNIDDSLIPDNLIFDLNSLNAMPIKVMDNNQIAAFKSFYAEIPTVNSNDTNEHIAKAKEYMKEKNIEFTPNDRVSLISVYIHSFIDENANTIFIGHTGLLISLSDNSLLFIEKLAFDEPYQAVKLANREQLNEYLMKKYDVAFDDKTASPFIMENDNIMDSYTVLGDNK